MFHQKYLLSTLYEYHHLKYSCVKFDILGYYRNIRRVLFVRSIIIVLSLSPILIFSKFPMCVGNIQTYKLLETVILSRFLSHTKFIDPPRVIRERIIGRGLLDGEATRSIDILATRNCYKLLVKHIVRAESRAMK